VLDYVFLKSIIVATVLIFRRMVLINIKVKELGNYGADHDPAALLATTIK